MEKSLVIVESPAKAKTINRYLGPGYIVKASMGHIRDLPKSKLGVDVEHDFTPTYVVIPERKKIVAELKKAAKEAAAVILAADPDREGEAICWHLSQLARAGQPEHPPGRLPRDHQAGRRGGLPAPGGARPEHVQRPAGPPHPGPAGRLPHQPAAVEEDRPGAERRPGPVDRPAAHLRAGEGDPGLQSPRNTGRSPPTSRPRSRRRSRPTSVQDRRQEGQDRRRRRGPAARR